MNPSRAGARRESGRGSFGSITSEGVDGGIEWMSERRIGKERIQIEAEHVMMVVLLSGGRSPPTRLTRQVNRATVQRNAKRSPDDAAAKPHLLGTTCLHHTTTAQPIPRPRQLAAVIRSTNLNPLVLENRLLACDVQEELVIARRVIRLPF